MAARTWHQMVVALMMLSLFGARPLEAQRPAEVALGIRATRGELEAALEMFESAARSPGYSQELRERARQGAAAVRTRLQQGDFRTGDPILLEVEGPTTLSDTFVVNSRGAILIPTLGRVSLRGVLRSELETYLTEQIALFFRDPIVSANSLIRISVMGEVGRVGVHYVGPETPLSDALMVPGMTTQSKVEDIRIVRRRGTILKGDDLQRAMLEGSTLAELGIRSGDQIIVPQQPQRLQLSPFQVLQSAGFITGFIFTLSRIF